MFKEKVTALLNEVLEERKDLFLIDFEIGSGNKINVVLDGDNGVNLKDCMLVSRNIEHNLDREEEDFSLEVASAGASTPLKMLRQYKKNIGRNLAVKMIDLKEYEGVLSEVIDDKIVLKWKAREPKPVGKGKVTVQKVQEIEIAEIGEAKVIIKF